MLIWSLKLQKNTERKSTLVTSCVLFQMLQLNSRPQLKYFSEKLLLSQKLCYLQREPSLTRHNVLSYYQHDQQLSIARYQVISFYSNNYFKYLQPIVSSVLMNYAFYMPWPNGFLLVTYYFIGLYLQINNSINWTMTHLQSDKIFN